MFINWLWVTICDYKNYSESNHFFPYTVYILYRIVYYYFREKDIYQNKNLIQILILTQSKIIDIIEKK